MRTGFGVLLALWGVFFVVFSRRFARGQYPRGPVASREAAAGGVGPRRGTTALNVLAGAALAVCGVLLAVGAF